MNKFIIPLAEASGKNSSLVGPKAASLARIIEQGMRVPDGFCITRSAYDFFMQKSGLKEMILLELGRKPFEEMRWEEIWDASLRIRNMYGSSVMPMEIKESIIQAVSNLSAGSAVAVRSASLAEDGSGSSFAGLHDSFVNICDMKRVIECVQLVWASLWSDAALLYRKELGLDVKSSAMTVIIQRMVCGSVSGVGFCVNPVDSDQAVIESVYGLNQGLVDGDVEPDRFFINRKTGDLVSVSAAEHELAACPVSNGVRIKPCAFGSKLSLSSSQVNQVYEAMQKAELLFGKPQDVEWTIFEDKLFLLQSRPVTMHKEGENGWYLSLHRSLDNLQYLEKRIEEDILPGMEMDAVEMEKVDLSSLSTDALAEEIQRCRKLHEKWHESYWDECIPFAHGVRLFATVYNDRMHPDDPFEFIDLLAPQSLISFERNQKMQLAADYLQKHPQCVERDGSVRDRSFKKILMELVDALGVVQDRGGDGEDNINLVVNFIQKIAEKSEVQTESRPVDCREKEEMFICSFSEDEKSYAREIIRIARKSYKLRDDDNIFLGRVDRMMTRVLDEAARRLGERYDREKNTLNPEELITALRIPGYKLPWKSESEIEEERKVVNARQLRGQPACKGVARGRAYVINSQKDIHDLEKGDIVVCDAIDPTMTFCIPLARAVVERRGGMLIHGAIIAREYGIPCVTGVPHVTEFVKTGDDITVDGYYGLVINHSRTVGDT